MTFLIPLAVLSLCAAGAQPALGARAALGERDPARPAEERPGPPSRLALVVGIDTYAPGKRAFRPLKGCTRDAARVREVLVERFEFAPEDVLVLLDEQATVAAIVRAFDEHLIRRAGPETEVVFWFSGHGSRVPDASGRELGNLDSSLIGWDSRAGERDGSFDLSDDLLESLRRRLTSVTRRVTIVTDACHSGGVTRSGSGPRFRATPPGSERVELALFEPFWPDDAPILDDDDPRRVDAGGYVHIAACSPEQQAQELDLEDGTAQGALTFFLTRGLIDAQPGTSYAALARDVGVRLRTRLPGQTLCTEGSADRTLFGARFAPRAPGHPARAIPSTRGPGQLSIQAGTMLGLRPGARLEVLHDLSDKELGTATVVRANTYSALAEWDDSTPETLPEGSLRAIERSRPAGQDPLRVAIALPELLDRLESSPLVEPAEKGVEDAYRVELAEGRVALIAPDDVRVWTEPEDDAGEAWDAERIRRVARALLAEFREELTYGSLLSLSLSGGPLRLDARFVAPNADELKQWSNYPDARVTELVDGSWVAPTSIYHVTPAADRSESGLAVLEIRNPTKTNVYVSVLSIMEDRSRYLVWPHEGRRELLAAGGTLRTPIGVQGSQSWNLDRPMRDRYLVFATTLYADFSVLDRDAPRTRGGNEGLPELIQNALRGPVTRGASPLAVEAADWGVVTVDLLVEHG